MNESITPDIIQDKLELLINDIRVGVCKVVFAPNQRPVMYGDPCLHMILGAEERITSEELYAYWYERIDPAYLTYVDAAMERMLDHQKSVEVEYLWHHPYFNRIVIRQEVTFDSRKADQAIVIKGLLWNITERMKDLEWHDNDHDILDYYTMQLCGKNLVNDYEELAIIDPKTRKLYRVASKNPYGFGDLNGSDRSNRADRSGLQKGMALEDFVGQCIVEEDQKKVNRVFSEPSIENLLQSGAHLHIDFRRVSSDEQIRWMRGTLRTIEINHVQQILFVLRDVHEDYRLKQDKEDVLYSITAQDAAIYEYHLDTKQASLLKNDIKRFGENSNPELLPISEIVDTFCTCHVDRQDWKKVQQFFSPENIEQVIRKQRKDFITIWLKSEKVRREIMKISIYPSTLVKSKAYLSIEMMDQSERLYPILEKFVKTSTDDFFCIDLQTDYFLQLSGKRAQHRQSFREGFNYTQAMHAYVDQYVVAYERKLIKRKMDRATIGQKLQDRSEYSFIYTIFDEDQQARKILANFMPFDQSTNMVLMQRTDITDVFNRELEYKKAQREAVTDPLTQVYNRLGSERLIQMAMEEGSEISALLLFDLDDFKQINDTYGHLMGDQILYQVGQTLTECFRKNDIIARYGGDEFIVFVTNLKSEDDIHPIVDRVIKRINQDCQKVLAEFEVNASLGIAFYENQSFSELISQADLALYQAKNKKNGYSVHDQRMYRETG